VNVRWIEPTETLGAKRGDTVVCIPVYGGHEHFVACLRSVLEHTPTEVRILICDDASPDARSAELVSQLEGSHEKRELFYLRRLQNLGFPGNVNGAFMVAAPADVVILNSDCVVAAGWLEGLRDAAYHDSRVATATALTNCGSIVSVPGPSANPQLPQEWTVSRAAAAVHKHALRIRPRLPTAVGHCVFIRRSALELVGGFDVTFSPGYGEEVDFSQRCIRVGLFHVAADDVFVYHYGGASLSANGKPSAAQAKHERILAARYPYYHAAVRAAEADLTGPLARARSAARRALQHPSLAIDARVLSGPMTGTQLHVLEMTAALARSDRLTITVLVPEDLSDYAERALGRLHDIRLVNRDQVTSPSFPRADVVHRPYQVFSADDVPLLKKLGERVIVTNQDLISYHNPSYFTSGDRWLRYRWLTRHALAAADRVVFFSAHARDDALAEDLVEPGRASVVHIGVDHSVVDDRFPPTAPQDAMRLSDDAEVILCLGADFRHKNRVFALRLLEQLNVRHDWGGYLVFAGPHASEGSSAADEAETLVLRPKLGGAVLDFAAVNEREKKWLYQRASLVLYPTVVEGFGLVPFEAADQHTPCMWAAGTALAEILPPPAGEIVEWNAELSADRAMALMRDADARARNLAAIREAGVNLTWDAAATALVEIYLDTCDAPAAPAGALEQTFGLAGPLSEDAMRLIGPHGVLPTNVERPLLALATHPQIGRPVFEAIRLGYRTSYSLRRWRSGPTKGGGDRV
jgi:GT2 family glycosyltransferase/glycosyltransferase involved in cell wall biosynthesis